MEENDIMLKVQAFVDGELPESEQGEIAALIARDPDVHELVKELKQTRQALAQFEEDRELPESADFYWSRIRREIDQEPRREPEAARVSLLGLFTRWVLPAGAAAAMVFAVILLVRGPGAAGHEVAWTAMNDEVNAFTYRDYDEGMTLMWLSYPADNTVAEFGEPATLN